MINGEKKNQSSGDFSVVFLFQAYNQDLCCLFLHIYICIYVIICVCTEVTTAILWSCDAHDVKPLLPALLLLIP